jgi:hypothetical protein
MPEPGFELTDPHDFELSVAELRIPVREALCTYKERGVGEAVIFSAYLTEVWRFMIAYYGGTLEASIQLSKVSANLQEIGPRLEAQLKGHKLH